jgi:ADP-heptose:LPS heptosyltransferase
MLDQVDAVTKRCVAAPQKPVERILIYRIGSLGDTVVALPSFHKLAEVFPDAERYVLTNIPVSSKAAALELILGQSGLIDGVVNYPIQMRSIGDVWRLWSRLRAFGAKTLIYLVPRSGRLPVLRDLLFFRLCGFTRFIGMPLTKTLQVDQIEADTGLVEYECHRLARSIAEIGPTDLDDPKNWDLLLTEAEQEAGDRAITPFAGNPFVAINMGGKVIEKHWGQENWRQLLRELSGSFGGYGLLFLGAADEAAAVEEVSASWPSTVVNSCGKLAPRESAAALKRASLFVGHDSGPMHLAAAVGIVCVAPFGSLNKPRKWYPYGKQHRIVHRADGVTNVKVEQIVAKVREVLPERAVPRLNAKASLG